MSHWHYTSMSSTSSTSLRRSARPHLVKMLLTACTVVQVLIRLSISLFRFTAQSLQSPHGLNGMALLQIPEGAAEARRMNWNPLGGGEPEQQNRDPLLPENRDPLLPEQDSDPDIENMNFMSMRPNNRNNFNSDHENPYIRQLGSNNSNLDHDVDLCHLLGSNNGARQYERSLGMTNSINNRETLMLDLRSDNSDDQRELVDQRQMVDQRQLVNQRQWVNQELIGAHRENYREISDLLQVGNIRGNMNSSDSDSVDNNNDSDNGNDSFRSFGRSSVANDYSFHSFRSVMINPDNNPDNRLEPHGPHGPHPRRDLRSCLSRLSAAAFPNLRDYGLVDDQEECIIGPEVGSLKEFSQRICI
jgi:hypothetical protein